MARHAKSGKVVVLDGVDGGGRHRPVPGSVRVAELGLSHLEASRGARYVGRVGALAVALGVGAAMASLPLAAADTSGSSGSAGSASTERVGTSSGRGSASAAPKGARASESGRGSGESGGSGESQGAGSGGRGSAGGGSAAGASRASVTPDINDSVAVGVGEVSASGVVTAPVAGVGVPRAASAVARAAAAAASEVSELSGGVDVAPSVAVVGSGPAVLEVSVAESVPAASSAPVRGMLLTGIQDGHDGGVDGGDVWV